MSEVRTALLARRAVLERELRAGAVKRQAERNGNVPDSAELAADDVARDVTLAEIERDTAEIEAIDAALARIEADTYGLCTQCGAAIAANRLAQHPEAARCIDCQESYEHRAALRIARL